MRDRIWTYLWLVFGGQLKSKFVAKALQEVFGGANNSLDFNVYVELAHAEGLVNIYERSYLLRVWRALDYLKKGTAGSYDIEVTRTILSIARGDDIRTTLPTLEELLAAYDAGEINFPLKYADAAATYINQSNVRACKE